MRRIFHILLLHSLLACERPRPLPAYDPGELVVLTRKGPLSYATDEAATTGGFDHDLVQLFARDLGKTVRFIVVGSDAEIAQKLKEGEAHLAAAWLTSPEDPELRSGPIYAESRDVLVTHEASLPIGDIDQLAEMTVHVVAGSRQAAALREIGAGVPGLRIVEEAQHDELDLLENVAGLGLEAALVDHAIFDIGGNYYPELQASQPIGPMRQIGWLFAPGGDPELLIRAEGFFAELQRNGEMARLKDRYFGHVARLTQADSVRFIERVRSVLPKYRAMFQSAQASTGIDWRLLAALAYQESQWNPLATSPTNVRGMMMLTEETADRLGVSNRLNAQESIRAGARYLGDLRDNLPASVKEPDRQWLALAAYNLGMGHMNGARSIAQSMKANPDSWYEMKKVLPLLVKPEYYKRLKSGKARGGEAVIMVENIRVYVDILNRHEGPHQVREKTAIVKRQ